MSAASPWWSVTQFPGGWVVFPGWGWSIVPPTPCRSTATGADVVTVEFKSDVAAPVANGGPS